MPKMSKDSYISLAAAVFTLVALLHFWVIVTGQQLTIGDVTYGIWVNYLGFIVAGYMGIAGYFRKK